MLLGSGELGRELTISLKRLGCYVIAVDNYPWPYRGKDAPAQQVADKHVHCDMLNANQLKNTIEWHEPDIVVPEIEAIDTSVLIELEEQGMHIVPSAKAVDKTMNRDRIRDFAVELGIDTAKYAYAESLEELQNAYAKMNSKVVVKPVMSSSGKGQSTIEQGLPDTVKDVWEYALDNMRGDRPRVIIEEFIDFDFEITLLTVRSKGKTYYCDPIVHIQQGGDFKFSQQFESNNFWVLHPSMKMINSDTIQEITTKSRSIAKKITSSLTGDGLFGVEFFVKGNDVIFSELSPRPHDTGLVTLKSQNFSEFDLHARALLGLPIPDIQTVQSAQCHTINAGKTSDDFLIKIDQVKGDAEVQLFNKPTTSPGRRMGIILSTDPQAGRNAQQAVQISYG